MEFQNTIAYATAQADGGELTLSNGTWTKFPFTPNLVVSKNIVSGGAGTFQLKVKQTGVYWVDFSFIADGGDGKNYFIDPYVNNAAFGTTGIGNQIKFFQQPTTQKYEVSTNGLFNLTRDDILDWRIYVATASATDFFTRNIKMTIINLQQIGLH